MGTNIYGTSGFGIGVSGGGEVQKSLTGSELQNCWSLVFLNICNNKCLTQKASDITANVFTNNFNDSNDL